MGKDISTEEAAKAAELVAINMLATVKCEIGDLDKIKQFLKIQGFVQCTEEFQDQVSVVNGCSNILYEILGEKGRHARSALGTNSLPFNMCVEIEGIVEVEDGA